MSNLTLFEVRRQVQQNLQPKGAQAKKAEAPVKTAQETRRETTRKIRENARPKPKQKV